MICFRQHVPPCGRSTHGGNRFFSFFRTNADNLLYEKGFPPIFSYRIALPVGMGLQATLKNCIFAQSLRYTQNFPLGILTICLRKIFLYALILNENPNFLRHPTISSRLCHHGHGYAPVLNEPTALDTAQLFPVLHRGRSHLYRQPYRAAALTSVKSHP